MVYFIGNVEKQLVKIGHSVNIEKRITALRTGFPYKLNILKVVSGDYYIERKLHDKFKYLRLEGEWFELNNDLLNFINLSEEDILEEISHSKHIWFKGHGYMLNESLEELYNKGISNIDIAKTLNVSIYKVRRYILNSNLSDNRIIKDPKPTGYYIPKNARKQAYIQYRKGNITQEDLLKILNEYPRKRSGKHAKLDILV